MQFRDDLIEQYDLLYNDNSYLGSKVKEDLSTKGEIQKLMLDHPMQFFFWSEMESLAASKSRYARMNLDDIVGPSIRMGLGKMTVKDKEDNTVSNPMYQSAKNLYLDAQTFEHIIHGVVQALRHKKDMLQSINSRQREELRSV